MLFNVEFHGVFSRKIEVKTAPTVSNVAPLLYNEDGMLIAVGFDQIKAAIDANDVTPEAMGCIIHEINNFESLHFGFELKTKPEMVPVEFRYENKALFGGTTDYPIPAEIREKVQKLLAYYQAK